MFVALIETRFNGKVRKITYVNGAEFVQHNCHDSFAASKRIIHHRSIPYIPQQNGRIERKHKHIVVKSFLLDFGEIAF